MRNGSLEKTPVAYSRILSGIAGLMLIAGAPLSVLAETNWYVDANLGVDDGAHGANSGAAAFKTIQYAVDDSRVTDTCILHVAAGTYGESVAVNKALTIQGTDSVHTLTLKFSLYTRPVSISGIGVPRIDVATNAASVQDAVLGVSTGGAVYVAAGQYPDTIVIGSKSVRLYGAKHGIAAPARAGDLEGETVLTNSYPTNFHYMVNSDGCLNFVFDGFVLDGAPAHTNGTGCAAIWGGANSYAFDIRNNIIRNQGVAFLSSQIRGPDTKSFFRYNRMDTVTKKGLSSYCGLGFAFPGIGVNLVLEGNVFSNVEYLAAGNNNASCSVSNVLYSNNRFYDIGQVAIQSAASAGSAGTWNLKIVGNYFDNTGCKNADITACPGVLFLSSAANALTNAYAIGNEFVNSTNGLTIGGWNFGTNIVDKDLHVNYNRFYCSGTSVYHTGLGTLDATNNWWGTANPEEITPKIIVTNLVAYQPFLTTDHADIYVALTGDDANEGVSADAPKRTLQAAVSACFPGGTIHAADGAYAEVVVVDRRLTIHGTNGATTAKFVLTANPVVVTGLSATNAEVSECGKIQEAVNAVSAGGTVIVNAGTYNETIVISKTLTLVGANSPSIEPPAAGVGIAIDTGTVSVTGFTIRGGAIGVEVTGEGRATIAYNLISDNSDYGLNNVASSTVDARFNWWGDDSGPAHPGNPSGLGDRVSDRVLYNPWLPYLIAAPTGVTANVRDGFIRLTWYPAENATRYLVYKNTTNATASAALVQTVGAVTNWDDTATPPSITYWYWLKAANATSTSTFSSAASGACKEHAKGSRIVFH